MPSMSFQIGSTSYVYEAGLAENAERLASAGLIQDMELVLFELADGQSNFPDTDTIDRLTAVRQRHGLNYTVHLPLDLRSAPDGLHPSLEQARRVIALTRPLAPWAYVAHLDGDGRDADGWGEQALAALRDVVGLAAPSPLAVENLETYDAALFAPLLKQANAQRCIDVGHLWKQGRDPLPLLDAGLPEARVVHLHGCVDGRDHISLAQMSPAQLDPVVRRLATFSGVVTLEVFGEEDFFSSRVALLASMERVADGA